jgi:hypothetical protein
VVYHTVFLAKTYRTPFLRMVMIEALEATFACFNEPVFRLVRELGLADRLHYFGQVHQHAEASHAKDQDDAATPDYTPNDEEFGAAVRLSDELFHVFARMFDCWHAAGRNDELMRAAA